MMAHLKKIAAAVAAVFGLGVGHAAVTVIPTGDTAFVNESIGTTLNGTSIAFPTSGDPSLVFGPGDEPDLSAAAAILGDWLGTPPTLNMATGWSATETTVPSSWTVGTEIALVYEFEVTQSLTDVIASVGVDNGVFVWIDGVFVGGQMQPGTAIPGEYMFDLGSLGVGTHYLAFLLEDHGGATGFDLEVTAEVGQEVPLPFGALLFGTGLVAFRLKRAKRQA